MKKTWGIIIIFLLIVIAIGGITLFEKGKPGSPQTGSPFADKFGTEIVQSGTVACLPHKDTTGPQTLECAIGLKGDDGMYFGLQASNPGLGVPSFETGKTVRVTGVLQEPEAGNKYNTVGTIDVSSVEVVNQSAQNQNASGTSQSIAASSVPNGWTVFSDEADGFRLAYPSDDFAVVKKSEKISAEFSSYIPPCGEGSGDFLGCVYFTGKEYSGTNFGSAGVSVQVLKNATTEQECEAGENVPVKTATHQESINGQNFFVFESGDAAMSHQSDDILYQVWHNNQCFQIDARLTSSVYEVYATGTIQKFTDQDKQKLESSLQSIVQTFSFL
ncbi:MAG TPA: hypothetical protein VFM02_02290 [Candidatus Paceibacterota bacterium]|nr:hypothetical protein [Candidatus Paceibacterota bacterium]